MNGADLNPVGGDAGAFGVNYALRPHKFVDRKVFMEVLNRFGSCVSLDGHAYVGLGSFALEDHKLMNATFGTRTLISLEVESDVVARQQYNKPLACIKPTNYSTNDFILHRETILAGAGTDPDANIIAWFDMTSAQSVRAHVDSFGELLKGCKTGDVVRVTVDVDSKTLVRKLDAETSDQHHRRQLLQLRELLGPYMSPGATARKLSEKLGIANVIVQAFKLVAEDAFQNDRSRLFQPLSLTTYADGHRMLSVTGAVVKVVDVKKFKKRMNLGSIPGGASAWGSLTNIQIPQLTVWEKLNLDQHINVKTPTQLAAELGFRLHETISTEDLIDGYAMFHRFYPNFRHFVL